MRLSYLFNAISLVLIYIGIVAFTPITVALYYNEMSAIMPFLITGIASILLGCLFRVVVNKFLTKDNMTDIKKTEGLTIVLLSWIIFSIIASVPYMFFGISVVDSFFEGISGATTTGASILTHYNYPHAMFFWRSFTQWIGGMGIIILFIAILPQFAVAGRQMFFAEAPGPTEDKLTPRIKNTASALWVLYIVLTIIQTFLLVYFKMPWFDAICNSFSAISSGGFSPSPTSIAGYNSIPICWILIVFMFLSGCNLALLYKVVTQFRWKLLWKNEEFLSYLFLVFVVAIGITIMILIDTNNTSFKNFTDSMFTVISIMTSTGFASCDYAQWPISGQILLLIVVLFGSSAGSTGGGIKVMRGLIVFKYLKRELVKLIHPNAVITIKMDRKTVQSDIISQIIAFVMFYLAIFLFNAILVTIIENNAVIGFSGSVSMLNLIGPGYGEEIGPAGNYASVHSATKIIFMINMLVGRLELVPFLMLFNRDYWVFKK